MSLLSNDIYTETHLMCSECLKLGDAVVCETLKLGEECPRREPEPAQCVPEITSCANTMCGHHDALQEFNCKSHPKPSMTGCKNFWTWDF